jgi:Dihydrodipicolinate synthetase family
LGIVSAGHGNVHRSERAQGRRARASGEFVVNEVRIAKFEDIYTRPITPFTPDGEIDKGAFAVVIESLIDAGVHGIILGGSTGEYYAQTPTSGSRVCCMRRMSSVARPPHRGDLRDDHIQMRMMGHGGGVGVVDGGAGWKQPYTARKKSYLPHEVARSCRPHGLVCTDMRPPR